MERIELLTAKLRHIYGDARLHKNTGVPCSDYVSEQKLIRVFKQSINSDIIDYIERFKEDNVLTCIREIIGRKEENESDN